MNIHLELYSIFWLNQMQLWSLGWLHTELMPLSGLVWLELKMIKGGISNPINSASMKYNYETKYMKTELN